MTKLQCLGCKSSIIKWFFSFNYEYFIVCLTNLGFEIYISSNNCFLIACLEDWWKKLAFCPLFSICYYSTSSCSFSHAFIMSTKLFFEVSFFKKKRRVCMRLKKHLRYWSYTWRWWIKSFEKEKWFLFIQLICIKSIYSAVKLDE